MLTTVELRLRMELIRQLEEQKDELEAQLEALKDSIKAEMTERGVNELVAGTHSAKLTRYQTTRFNMKAFKADKEDLYRQYTYGIEASRFEVR